MRTNNGQHLPSNSRICPVSIRCLDSFRCLSVRILSGFPLSVYPAGQGRDRAVRTRTRQSCPDFHCRCPPTSVLIPDLRFDFAYGRFIHLFDHNFAQDSFRNEIFKFLKTSKTAKSIFHEKVIGIVLSNILIGFGAGLIDTGLSNPTQTSADKDTKSPDTSGLSLSGRTDRQTTDGFFARQRTAFFARQRTKTRQG